MPLNDQDVAQLRRTLRHVEFVQYLDEPTVEQLIRAFEKAPMRKGDVLIEQGTIGSIFYLIGAGSVGVYLKQAFVDKRVAVLGPGAYVGEMALISKQPRSATVKCEEDGMAFSLLREDFRNILLGNPHISDIIMRMASKRKEALVDDEISARLGRNRGQAPGSPGK